MKYISFAIPSYNSESYLSKCVDSLLVGSEDVEILIIDDGSTDRTGEIADDYEKKYPNIVRAIHKENGGHGSGVNKGLECATGVFYKVVDSDDWLDEKALKELISTVKKHVDAHEEPDLYITNFIYDHVNDGTSYLSEYRKKLPVNKFFTWKEMKPFKLWKMLLMHSLTYNTEKLRATGIKLPEHTFYVDNIFAYTPLPQMKKLFYLDVDLYHYFIGRDDQSVFVKNAKNRYIQQIRVMNEMLYAYSYDDLKKMDKKIRGLCYHCLMAIMMNTTFFTTSEYSEERKAAYREMWQTLKEKDKKLYYKMKYRTPCALTTYMTWHVKGFVSTLSYNFLVRHVKLG